MRGLFLLAACGGHSSSRCAGLSVSRPLLLRSTSSRRASSVVVAHRPSCSAARGIFPDQGSNPCPRHWQADSTAPPGKPHLIYINALYHPKQILSDKRCLSGASLVARWLGTCLLMQETQVRALAWEDPTCRGASGPVSHSC